MLFEASLLAHFSLVLRGDYGSRLNVRALLPTTSLPPWILLGLYLALCDYHDPSQK